MAVQPPNGHVENESPVPYTDLFYDPQDSRNSVLKLIYWVRPEWKRYSQDLQFTKFTEGITNTLFKISRPQANVPKSKLDDDAILMRAYGNGTDLIIDRDSEATSHAMLAKRGMAPPLLGRFRNGLLYGYISGYVCKAEDFAQEPVWRGIAQRMAEWHARIPISGISSSKLPQSGVNGGSHAQNGASEPNGTTHASNKLASRQPRPNVWSVMQDWIKALPNDTEEQRAQKDYLQAELERSFNELDTKDGIGEQGFVFAHRDLLCANVIQLRNPDAPAPKKGVQEVTFIDYEYATPAPAAFDLANHLAEWVGFDCEYNWIPGRSVRRKFLQEYLAAYSRHTNQIYNECRVDDLFRLVDQWRGIPGLHWGIWALIQAQISDIDFDYVEYAKSRLGEYQAFRGEIDGTRASRGQPLPLRERKWAEE